MVTIPKRYFTVVTAYVHVFVAYLKFVNREFLWDLSSLFLILRPMHFWFSCENIVACCWEYLLHSVKNSCEFADFLRHKTLNACEELLSFDVVSLFTKIPLDLAAKVAEKRLRIGASLGQKTSLLLGDIIHLLSFCFKTTQFAYNGTYYQWQWKTWNKRALATSPVKPFFWKRYVDDVISAVSGNESERLLSHLNSIEPSTQFTLEREKDNMAASPINEMFWTAVHCFLFILEYWETWFDVNCIIEGQII